MSDDARPFSARGRLLSQGAGCSLGYFLALTLLKQSLYVGHICVVHVITQRCQELPSSRCTSLSDGSRSLSVKTAAFKRRMALARVDKWRVGVRSCAHRDELADERPSLDEQRSLDRRRFFDHMNVECAMKLRQRGRRRPDADPHLYT